MRLPFSRRAELDDAARAALVRLLQDPKFELIPLKSAWDQVDALPPGAHVTVTASPGKGIEATVDLAEQLAERGFRVVPHLSAHMIRDRAHLADLLARMKADGIDRAFVVGGDASDPGEFRDGLTLLRAMAELGHPFRELGCPCYPQGHPDVSEDVLLGALQDKAAYVQYMTTQLCFDPDAIRTWLAARRADGLALPVHVGVPGVAELHKLMAISARIGVSDARRFLLKNRRVAIRLALRPTGYKPDAFLEGLAPLMVDPIADIRDLHVYTFNQVASTEAWRRAFLERHAPPEGEVREIAG